MRPHTMQLHPRALVLARSGGAIQVGLDPPVVLRGLGSEERAFVASLEGGRPVSPTQARRFSRVVTRLTRAGAWWQALPESGEGDAVALYGCGRLGMAIASALAESGLDVWLHDDSPPAVEEAGLYGDDATSREADEAPGTCAGAAALTLAERGVRARVGTSGAALAVVTCVGSPDPALIGELMRADVPHVVVACTERDAWVSHVIVPGVSPCNRCRDLALSRDDPEWPLIALQLAGPGQRGRRPYTSNAARPVVAGLVCSALRGWLTHGTPGSGHRVAANGTFAGAPIAADPQCGCGAALPTSRLVTSHDLEDVRAV